MKNGILIAVLVIAAGAAAYFYWPREKGGLPDTPESATPWVCEHCGFVKQLTAKQLDEWLHSDRMVRGESVPHGRIYFECPSCGNPSLCDGEYCEVHDKYYVVWDTQGMGPHLCDLCEEEALRQMSP